MEVGQKVFPYGYRVFAGRDFMIVSCHDVHEGPIFLGAVCFLLIVIYCGSISGLD